jgi:anti-sigma factor ChrR (cupin superfamily)
MKKNTFIVQLIQHVSGLIPQKTLTAENNLADENGCILTTDYDNCDDSVQHTRRRREEDRQRARGIKDDIMGK